jgi:hypothetical protein
MLVSLYIWLSALFGVPSATGQAGLLDVGDQQAMTSSASGGSSSSGSKNRGLSRKTSIYNGF